MSDLYNATPSQFGGFTSPVPGGSTNKGYYQQPMNLPFYQGRSILATIPEYQRNPLMLERDLLFKVSEGRANFMKILLESVEMGGGYEVNDVRYRMPIEAEPVPRIYLDAQTAAAGAVDSNGHATFKIRGNTTPISTAMPGGNPKQVGDIARLEVGQFLMCMFSYVEPRRTDVTKTDAGADSTAVVNYQPNPTQHSPVPEIWKIVGIDYAKSKITVQRNWAGEQRTSFTYSTTTIPSVQILGATDTTAAVWGAGAGRKVPAKQAFVIPMPKSMKEDEIDAKVKNYSNTWQHGIMQRHLLAWGSQYMSEVISQNLGIESPLVRSKRQAIKDFYDHWEWWALFGEKSEVYDTETGYWSGTTDGLLANIPKSHYLALKGIDYSAGFTAGSSSNLGSFHPLIFNKIMEGKGYIGSQKKVLVCGDAFHTAFTTMINFMTQNVPDIKSEWKVEGKVFRTSGGLEIEVVPSDKMSLNGMNQAAVLYDKDTFRTVKLKGYPGADIYEINNENPLKRNGFIHGVKSFIDRNPDANWVFTVVEKTKNDGSSNASLYASMDVLGQPLE